MKQPPTPSYYRATAAPYESYAPLQGQHETHIAIVGGGYAGLNTALGLAERGVRDVVMLEREQIRFGASGRNGGFVFGGYSLEAVSSRAMKAAATPSSTATTVMRNTRRSTRVERRGIRVASSVTPSEGDSGKASVLPSRRTPGGTAGL